MPSIDRIPLTGAIMRTATIAMIRDIANASLARMTAFMLDRTADDYCRRPDGTTGLIVAGVAGGVLGCVITSGRSATPGTIIGAATGALAGRAIEQGSVR